MFCKSSPIDAFPFAKLPNGLPASARAAHRWHGPTHLGWSRKLLGLALCRLLNQKEFISPSIKNIMYMNCWLVTCFVALYASSLYPLWEQNDCSQFSSINIVQLKQALLLIDKILYHLINMLYHQSILTTPEPPNQGCWCLALVVQFPLSHFFLKQCNIGSVRMWKNSAFDCAGHCPSTVWMTPPRVTERSQKPRHFTQTKLLPSCIDLPPPNRKQAFRWWTESKSPVGVHLSGLATAAWSPQLMKAVYAGGWVIVC